jgi:hypothetical protein
MGNQLNAGSLIPEMARFGVIDPGSALLLLVTLCGVYLHLYLTFLA